MQKLAQLATLPLFPLSEKQTAKKKEMPFQEDGKFSHMRISILQASSITTLSWREGTAVALDKRIDKKICSRNYIDGIIKMAKEGKYLAFGESVCQRVMTGAERCAVFL